MKQEIDSEKYSLEKHLIKQARAGDGNAFASLISKHLTLLYRIALRYVGNTVFAEDVIQESLIIAFKKLGQYKPGTSFRAFLAGICVQKAYTMLRSEQRRKKREHTAEPSANPITPEEAAIHMDISYRISDALKNLPKKRQAAAILRFDGGLSYKEIGENLNISENSARVHVYLAQKDLRKRLGDVA